MSDIAKNIKELRDKSGLSLRALAEAVGVSHNTLATYERQGVIPTVNNAVKICEYFQVPVEYLLYGKKVTTDFNDSELLKLFREIDEYSKEEKEIAKKFLKKLVKNVKGKERDGKRNKIKIIYPHIFFLK